MKGSGGSGWDPVGTVVRCVYSLLVHDMSIMKSSYRPGRCCKIKLLHAIILTQRRPKEAKGGQRRERVRVDEGCRSESTEVVTKGPQDGLRARAISRCLQVDSRLLLTVGELRSSYSYCTLFTSVARWNSYGESRC